MDILRHSNHVGQQHVWTPQTGARWRLAAAVDIVRAELTAGPRTTVRTWPGQLPGARAAGTPED